MFLSIGVVLLFFIFIFFCLCVLVILQNKGNMILVHCAFGIGRSSMTLCACMVAIGVVNTWSEAVPILQKSRSIVRINQNMTARLDLWEEQWKKRK